MGFERVLIRYNTSVGVGVCFLFIGPEVGCEIGDWG